MKEPEQFVYECPECLAKDKIIKRCVSCKVACCTNCSVRGECIECFVKNNKTAEVDNYFKLKELEIAQ